MKTIFRLNIAKLLNINVFLYFQSGGCILLSTGRKMQGFKANVSASLHLLLVITRCNNVSSISCNNSHILL